MRRGRTEERSRERSSRRAPHGGERQSRSAGFAYATRQNGGAEPRAKFAASTARGRKAIEERRLCLCDEAQRRSGAASEVRGEHRTGAKGNRGAQALPVRRGPT